MSNYDFDLLMKKDSQHNRGRVYNVVSPCMEVVHHVRQVAHCMVVAPVFAVASADFYRPFLHHDWWDRRCLHLWFVEPFRNVFFRHTVAFWHCGADVQVQCCFSSTETLRTIRDGEPRTATSTSTQVLSSDQPCSSRALLYVHTDHNY